RTSALALSLHDALPIFDGVPIHRSVVALQFEDGLARVDSLRIRTSAGSLEAEGDFGLVPERSGTIRVALRSDSLGALDRVLLPRSEEHTSELQSRENLV